MKLKKSATVLLLAAVLFCATTAQASDQKLTLNLSSGGCLDSEVTTEYILTIPAAFSVAAKGWNDIGALSVKASGDLIFTGNAVVVTATSSNDFALKTSGGEALSYTLTTASGGEKTTEFTFESADINTTGGASRDLWINITWKSTQPAGTYTDTITYTGGVQDAATGKTIDLSTLTGAYEAQDGDVLTGTGGSSTHITVAAGATIKLKGANITSIDDSEDNDTGEPHCP